MKQLVALSLSLWLFFSPALAFSQDATYTIYEADLTRLNEIFAGLSTKYEQATSELQNSKLDLAVLTQSLENSQAELASWKDNFAKLESELTASRSDSAALRVALQEAKNSLERASKSFDEYRKEAEALVRKLTFQRDLYLIASIVFGLLALIGYVR